MPRRITATKPSKTPQKKKIDQVLEEQLGLAVEQGIQLGFSLLTAFLVKKLTKKDQDSHDSKPGA